MALKTFNPTTPAQRQLVIVDRSELWKGKPVKALTEGQRGKGGRNNTGRITVRWRGGGHKQRYRIVDFKRTKIDCRRRSSGSNTIPNRTAFIALIKLRGRRARLHPGAAAPEGRATRSCRATGSTSSPATRCRCATCRSARSSTMSR